MPAAKRRPTAKRPNLSRAVRLLIRDVARRVPEFAHVRADQLLVVAGEARRASRATIRPLRFQDTGRLTSKRGTLRKPRIRFKGHDVLYVITLRPLFFRASTPETRVETVLHELFHVSEAFDGTLDPARRHAALPAEAFDRAFRPIVKRYLASCPDEVLARLAVDGEVLVRQWLEKPPRLLKKGSRQRRSYDDRQTFLGPVRMITRSTRH
jgi:hypothetical protein